MMTLAERYKRIRRKHTGIDASNAFRWAKQEEKETAREYDGSDIANGPVEITRGKFNVHISAEIDESPDYSYIGEYSMTWQEGAVRVPESRYDRNVCKWFIPCNTETEHYQSLVNMKYGKTLARELARSYVKQDMARMDNLQSFVIIVRAYLNGVELGSDVLGGVDIGDDIDYLADAVDEHGMIDNAVVEAETALAGLWAIAARSRGYR
jgi:hypothetical protein